MKRSHCFIYSWFEHGSIQEALMEHRPSFETVSRPGSKILIDGCFKIETKMCLNMMFMEC